MNKINFNKLKNISSPILITGDTGTGKSKMARKIFDLADIHKEKFLTVHLASLKDELFESELFGHRKGAFTGAIENKNGYFFDVGKGTLFLDEIGELSLETQKKLLYLLEEKKFTPVGSTSVISFEGRIIMATNKNLKNLVKEGKFRSDLYYRLSVFQLELKAISNDKEKLKLSIFKYFEIYKNLYSKKTLSMDNNLFELLIDAPWKGNYRELKNCLEYMVALSDRATLTQEDLPIWFWSEVEDEPKIASKLEDNLVSHFPGDFMEAIEKFESLYLRARLKSNKGRVNETARLIGISKATLISKSRKYGIDTLSMRAEAGRIKVLNSVA